MKVITILACGIGIGVALALAYVTLAFGTHYVVGRFMSLGMCVQVGS